MIMWKGWGILGLFPLLFACIIFQLDHELGIPRGGGKGDGVETGIACVLLASGLFWLGRRMNAKATRFADAPHSLYLIPLQFYGIPLYAVGIFLLIVSLW